MEAGTEISKEAVVLEIASELYSKQDWEKLSCKLNDLIEEDPNRHVIVDFSRARWFGAPILDELVVAAETLHQKNRELLLVGSPIIDRMLNAARVDRVKLFANVQTALASFGSPAHTAAYPHEPAGHPECPLRLGSAGISKDPNHSVTQHPPRQRLTPTQTHPARAASTVLRGSALQPTAPRRPAPSKAARRTPPA